ncbi:MAG: HNH endonuclease [Myxococcota bacterium]
MKSFVAVTDFEWFDLLRRQPDLVEVNFWQPGGTRLFKTIGVGDLFLFKLHSPRNFIVGGGLLAHSSLLPISLAWSSFGIANGVRSLQEMRERTLRYRRRSPADREDFTIGCILLSQPFFLPESQWVPVPEDWRPNIVQGKTYDLTVEPGATMVRRLQEAQRGLRLRDEGTERYGEATLVRPRLGQGSFRVVVTDAYQRRCAITGERVLPVLEAAHVRPYASGGEHSVENGLLLRSDLHTLFDRGYLTITPDRELEVSSRIHDEFHNGREYYALGGRRLRPPRSPDQEISAENIHWHNERVYLGG